MEISGVGGTGGAALLQQVRGRRPQPSEAAEAAGSSSAGLAQASAGSAADGTRLALGTAEDLPRASLSGAMLNILFSAQAEAGSGDATPEAQVEVATRLTAMLQRALTAYQPEDASAAGTGRSVSI
ncbi:hypothetical protein ACVFYP_10060 [Roseomonas sp. F4]